MRHGGAAALPFAEGFLRFANFGALQVPDFQRDSFERRADMGQPAEILRMTVSLNYLGCHGGDTEPEPLADALLNFSAKVRGGTNGARNLSHGHLRCGVAEALDVSLVLGEPVGDFQAERHGFGMDAVGTADLRSMAELMCAEIEDFSEHHQVALN